jgi:hypothetical protein
MKALELEYKDDEPEQYAARVKAVASLIFFAAPDILPPAGGKLTPFHGLDEAGFEALMAIEDEVFGYHMGVAGGSAGVRPFSVCETKYMIEKYVREGKQYSDFDSYKAGFTAYAAACSKADVEEWYNFRGLGGLRPSWVESNIMDRFLRRMNGKCAGTPAQEWTAECAKWNADRLDYRLKGNRQLAGRQMFYDPATQESYLTNPQNMVALLAKKRQSA